MLEEGTNGFNKLLDIVDRLSAHNARFYISPGVRMDARSIMMLAFAGGYWEIEVFEDGRIEVEEYRAQGGVREESDLQEMWSFWEEEE